jgi:beta-lactamase superfamily II metal-dependent hydrolase
MGELHCLNVGFGDASVILTESATFLVDCHNISNFSYLLPNNKNIRGMFITHQHEDHYSGLNYLKDNNYSIDCLIYSPYNRRYGDNSVTIEEWNEFNSLKEYFRNRGTKLYAPYRQSSFDEPYWDTDGARFEIIGPHPNVANSQTREIHDASLVIKAILGRRKCLFAGDASDANLKYIADYTSHYCDDILHASHHGSINGAHWEFIKKSNAQYTLISTKSGVRENVPHSIALRRYEEYTQHHVRRTDIDGTQKWTF